MTSLRDDLLKQINSAEEGVEIPDELLEIVSGGIDLGDKQYIEGAVIWYKKVKQFSLEDAIARNRDQWDWDEEKLQILRDIWDEV